MDLSIIITLIAAIVCLVIGLILGKVLSSQSVKKEEEAAREKAKAILSEAKDKGEALKKEKLLEAKEKFIQMKSDFEQQVQKKKENIIKNERAVKQKEQSFKDRTKNMDRKEAELESMKENVTAQLDVLKKRKNDLEDERRSIVSKLETVANLSANEAKTELLETLTREAETEASSKVKDIIEQAKLSAAKDAKKIVLETIQRTAAEHAIENCVSVFNLDSDDLKGKIIGREGRNIRSLEAATGVEIVVDDTPEAILISGFDPVRREIARLSLHRLVADGRIHPARIEEVVNKTAKDLEQEIMEIGERTVIDLGVNGLHPALIKMVGRMRFRSSYGQNLLQHSKEVAKLCSIMAAELGLDAKKAKRAGLLHDIGKVAPEETDLPHAIWGMQMAKKYNENPEICNAIGAHHDEVEMTSMISPIVQACDAISGSRPGARREVTESYVKRLKDMEALALDFEGVTKSFAIQAGRELRVLVDAESTDDKKAGQLSFDISQKIEKEMQYPGQVKVTVIREMRAVNFAK